MNSNRLNAAQLLMNYSAHENGKICQKIIDNEFSQELQSMTVTPQPDVAAEATAYSPDHSISESSRSGASTRPVDELQHPKSERPLKVVKSRLARTTLQGAQSASRKSLQSCRTGQSEQMVFSNPLLVESILAQLQFPAEVRQACKEAMNKEGNLPIDSLVTILGQKQSGGRAEGVSAAVSALDVQELMSSIKMGSTAVTTDKTKLKQAGLYNAQELRELIQPLSRDAARGLRHDAPSMAQSLMTPVTGSVTHPLEADSEARLDVGDWKAPEGHLELLSSSRLPSFSALRSRRSEEMQRHLSHDAPGGQDQTLVSDLGQTAFDRAMDSVRGLSVHRPTGQDQQYFRNAPQQDLEPGVLVARTGSIQPKTEWESTIAYSDPSDPTGWGSSKTSVATAKPPFTTNLAFDEGHGPPTARFRTPFEAPDAQEIPVVRSDEGRADLTADGRTTQITITSAENPSRSKPAFTEGHEPTSANFKARFEAGDAQDIPVIRSDETWGDLTADGRATQATTASAETPSRSKPAFTEGREPTSAGSKTRFEAPDAQELPVNRSDETWGDLTADGRATQTTTPSAENPSRSKPAFTEGHEPTSAGFNAQFEAGDALELPVIRSDETWADLTADGRATQTTTASAETPSRSKLAFAEGHEPNSTGFNARFEAGDALELPVDASSEGLADASSDLNIESLASSDPPFTSSGRTGHESSSSDHHQGKQDDQGIQWSRDESSEAQPKEVDAPFSLSSTASNAATATHVDKEVAKVNVYQPDWTQRITEHLHEGMLQGKTSLVVELEPEELGQMTLRIEADQGQVTAWITTQSEETRNLLQQNTSALQKHLAEHGLNLGQFNVNVGDERRNSRAYSGDREGRRVSKTAGKTGSGVHGPAVLPGIHSRLRGDGSSQRISLIA